METDAPAPTPEAKKPILRPLLRWTAVILAALGLAWFVAAVVVPYFQGRAAVHAHYSGRLGPPQQAVRKLAVYLKVSRLFSSEREHRPRAVFFLGSIGGRQAVLVLAAALKDSDAEIRSSAAVALRMIGPDAREAVPALAAALKDPDKEVRRSAATALCEIGPAATEAVPALEAVLNDQNEAVRDAAKRALENIHAPETKESTK